MSKQEQTKDWRQMTDEERMAIQDDVTIRQMEEQQRQLEQNRQRARNLVSNRRIWSIADMMVFVNKINSLARRHRCLDMIGPIVVKDWDEKAQNWRYIEQYTDRYAMSKQVFESREEFLEEAVAVLLQNGVPSEDVDAIFAINKRLNDEKVG